MRIKISTVLHAAPAEVWHAAKQISTLRYVTAGLLGFRTAEALTSDTWQINHTYGFRLWLFHVIPLWKHHLTVASINEEEYVLQSKEHGGMVTRWDHRIEIKTMPGNKTRYTDVLEIEAGFFTILIVFFSAVFYRYRQFRWKMFINSRFHEERGVTNHV